MGNKSEHKSLTPKKTLCDSERGLCEEAAQSGGGESVVLGGVWGVLRRTDRYAEAGREGYRRGRGLNRSA